MYHNLVKNMFLVLLSWQWHRCRLWIKSKKRLTINNEAVLEKKSFLKGYLINRGTLTIFCTGENELAFFLIFPYLLIDRCTGVVLVGVEDWNGTVCGFLCFLVLLLLEELVCFFFSRNRSWSTTSCISSLEESESDKTSNKSLISFAVVPVLEIIKKFNL